MLWLIEICFGTFLVSSLSFVLAKLRRKHFLINIHLPLQVGIWGVGISLCLDILTNHYGFNRLGVYIHHLSLAFVIFCLCWMALRYLRVAFGNLEKRANALGLAPGTLQGLRKLSSFIVVILCLMIMFQIFGLSVLPLLAFGGIGMAGVAFAAQDIVANFFGGVMLHFTRPFTIGELVELPEQNNFQGRVEEIGWYNTSIRDSDRRAVFFPNALFTKMNIVNLSRRTHTRILETLHLRYEDLPKIATIVESLRETLFMDPRIDNEQPINIGFSSFGEHSIEVLIDVLTPVTNPAEFVKVKQGILLLASDEIEKHEAQILPMSHFVNYSHATK